MKSPNDAFLRMIPTVKWCMTVQGQKGHSGESTINENKKKVGATAESEVNLTWLTFITVLHGFLHFRSLHPTNSAINIWVLSSTQNSWRSPRGQRPQPQEVYNVKMNQPSQPTEHLHAVHSSVQDLSCLTTCRQVQGKLGAVGTGPHGGPRTDSLYLNHIFFYPAQTTIKMMFITLTSSNSSEMAKTQNF